MINPCSECLVQVNCTQICEDKKVFQTWLKRAIEQYQHGRLATTPALRKLFDKYRNMESQNSIDMMHIKSRAFRIQHPESQTGSII